MAAAQSNLAARAEATHARLAAMTLPEGGFTRAARRNALERFTAMGLPVRRDEYWRWGDPDVFGAVSPGAAAAFRVDMPIFSDREK
ncbi:MAG: Fe-S cluster assembly protein SufD, partial [Albidovulum sp.]